MVYFVVCEFHLSKNTLETKDSYVHCLMMMMTLTMMSTILTKEKTLEVNRKFASFLDPELPAAHVGKRRELPFIYRV